MPGLPTGGLPSPGLPTGGLPSDDITGGTFVGLPSDDITGGTQVTNQGVSHIYEPRMSAMLNLVDIGVPQVRQIQASTTDSFKLDMRPLKARLSSNSWREADELELTVSWDEAGIDPRYLRSGELYFWLADGGDSFQRSNENLRFVGIIRDVTRELDETSKVVTLRAIDYTTLFIEQEHFPQKYLPTFSDTLRQAYKKICQGTGHINFSKLDANGNPTLMSSVLDPDTNEPIIQLVALGDVNLDRSIASSVNPRIQAAPLNRQSGADAWATWTYICSQLGLITYIRGSVCIVTVATEYYTSNDPPLFIYGKNVLTLTERRDLGQLTGKNLCIRSYDGMTGTMLESFFPPRDSSLAINVRKKKIILPSAKKASKALVTEDWDLIDIQIPVTDQALLDKLCETLWHERVRAELTGTLTTREMSVDTTLTGQSSPGSGAYDLLNLQAGDNITIQLEEDALDTIQALSGDSPKIAALLYRGYSPDMAAYIVANLSSITSMPAQFLVHSIATEVDASSDSGSYNVTIEFLNTLDASGGATTQIKQAPVIAGAPTDPVPDVSSQGTIVIPVTEISGAPITIPVTEISGPTPITIPVTTISG
jgi:hypothetical protein